MAINKRMRTALRLLSYPAAAYLEKVYKIERVLYNLKAPPIAPLYHLWDHKIQSVDGAAIRVRLYRAPGKADSSRLLLFFHGGGWVFESVDTYNQVCRRLAKATGCPIASVEYRRAPEHPFPVGLEDCYAAARAVYQHPEQFGVHPQDIVLIGDSAGGNLAAAVSLMARDRGEFTVGQQILIYPATAADHSPDSPFDSVRENGHGYLLTARRVEEFMRLYAGEDAAAMQNPYFAPLLMRDLTRQPRTLVITAEYDPLRDEGEAYAAALARAGAEVRLYRMPDALHGFFSLPAHFAPVQRAYAQIREFLGDDTACASDNRTSRTGTAWITRPKFSRRRFTGRTRRSSD